MADVKWIKIVTDIFDDEKILLIESLPEHDAIIVIWFKLLCLAGKMNNGGVFVMNNKIPYTEEMLATIFRRPLNTVRLALNTFEQFGMIERVENVITIPNWSKHQTLDQLEERKEYMREYMQKYREKQKQIACNVNGKVNSKSNSKANVNSLDIDIEEDKDIDIKSRAKSKRFVPPSIEEVKEYCKQPNNNVDAEQFIDFYESKGWMVGKNKMKDWKAAVRTWEKRENSTSQPTKSKPTNKFNQFPQREYTETDYKVIERALINKGLED